MGRSAYLVEVQVRVDDLCESVELVQRLAPSNWQWEVQVHIGDDDAATGQSHMVLRTATGDFERLARTYGEPHNITIIARIPTGDIDHAR